MTQRRRVRVDPMFFADLDAQLGEARGPEGQPSSTDFLLLDLPSIAAKFGEDFDELPAVFPDRTDYKYLVTTGRLVAAVVVVAQLVEADTIVLFSIDIGESDDP